MFGDEGASFLSTEKKETSDEFNQVVDLRVKKILDESHARVTKLLMSKESDIWELAKGLFWYDYLDAEEIKLILQKKPL